MDHNTLFETMQSELCGKKFEVQWATEKLVITGVTAKPYPIFTLSRVQFDIHKS